MHLFVWYNLISVYLPRAACTKKHLLDIALWEFDWRCVGRRLLDSDQAITDIDNDKPNEQNKRDEILISWHHKKGSKATYSVLMETFEVLKYGELAEKVKQLIEGNTGGRLSNALERTVMKRDESLHGL